MLRSPVPLKVEQSCSPRGYKPALPTEAESGSI